MADPAQIAASIAKALGAPGLIDALVALPQSELQSLLLFVQRRRSALRTPAQLLQQYQRQGMVQPGTADPRALNDIDRMAFAAADKFEAVELSPLAPVGLNVVLGEIDQNNSLATLRAAEVMADPTTALALECAQRRQRDPAATTVERLCTSARMVRLQPLKVPGHTPHFRLFALVTAGRDRGNDDFQTEALGEQLRFYLDWLRGLDTIGYRFSDVTITVADTEQCRARVAAQPTPERARTRLGHVEARVFPSLRRDFPAATLALDETRTHAINYYDGLCLHLDVTDPSGQRFNLADGGFTGWTQRLVGNRKERLLVSGAGSELIAKRFR
jgi:hypothetical protein